MAGTDRKKHRHEQKRREKRAALRRAEQGSPYKRIGVAGSVTACYINRDWREQGLASIRVLCRVPGGGHALAAFLVDLLCIGLKDAFGQLDVSAMQYEEHIRRASDDGCESVPVDMGTARRLVAGAIRWSHEHNFRLPARYERWVALLGDIGDWHTADLTGFGRDGKLLYVGELEDLRRRLIGTTLEEFLAREDVDYIGGFGPSALDDEDDEVLEAGAQFFQEKALDAVRKWCFASGLKPHPRLSEAVEVLVTSMLEAPGMTDEPPGDAATATALANMERLLSLEAGDTEAELRSALDQVSGFIKSFDSPEALSAALGIDDLVDDEEEEDI